MNDRIDAEYWQLIWNRFRSGDRLAFQTIYDEFVDSLFSYGSKITSDRDLLKDTIQDLFIDIYTYGSKLNKPESLEYYLFKSLKRIIVRKLIERSKFTSVQDIKEKFHVKFSIEEEVFDNISDSSIKRLQDEIALLAPEKRELLFLKFNSGMTYREIGKTLGIKPNTVKKQIYRLLDNLRIKYKKDLIVLLILC